MPDRVGARLGGEARRSRRRWRGAAMSQVNPRPGILLYTRIQKSPVLLRLPASRRRAVQRLQPPLPPAALWRSVPGVLASSSRASPCGTSAGPSGRSRSPDRMPSSSPTCSRHATCPGARWGGAKYAFITSQEGGIINDPVLLRLGENHFWLSLADTDVLLWAKGVAHKLGCPTCRSPSRTCVQCRSRGRSPRR